MEKDIIKPYVPKVLVFPYLFTLGVLAAKVIRVVRKKAEFKL